MLPHAFPRTALVIALGALLTAAAGCATDTPDAANDPCAAASAHVNECLGRSGVVLATDCDPAVADALLAQNCDEVAQGLAAEAGDIKADGPIDAVGCWLNLVSLEKCVPSMYIGFVLKGQVWREDNGRGLAYPDIRVRFTDTKNDKVVIETVSDGKGEFEVKMPTMVLGSRTVRFEVLQDDVVRYTATFKANFYYLDVVFGEDGTVTACKWVDDDACAEF